MVKTRIRLNYANCMNNQIGGQGITNKELNLYRSRFAAAYKNVVSLTTYKTIGFPVLPQNTELCTEVNQLATKLRYKFDNFVVIGIGGSALGNLALHQAIRHPYWNLLSSRQRQGRLRLFVLDNVDPEFVGKLHEVIDLKKTVFNVISKAGTTAECLANYFTLKQSLLKRINKNQLSQHVILTTDPEKGYLRELAQKEKFITLPIPDNVGGRFSVLSAVGLLSAAVTGININQLLTGASEMVNICSTSELKDNPAGMYAVLQYLFYQKGKPISVMMPYVHGMYGFADWYRQLWAESLGKKYNRENKVVNIGPTPVKALGVTDQHSQLQLYIEGPYDKIITFVSTDKFTSQVEINRQEKHYLSGHTLNELYQAEETATRIALTQNQRPNCTIELPEINEFYVGQFIMLLELATAYAGELFNVNAFDQPGVVLGKEMTYALMNRPGYEKKKRELDSQLRRSFKTSYLV